MWQRDHCLPWKKPLGSSLPGKWLQVPQIVSVDIGRRSTIRNLRLSWRKQTSLERDSEKTDITDIRAEALQILPKLWKWRWMLLKRKTSPLTSGHQLPLETLLGPTYTSTQQSTAGCHCQPFKNWVYGMRNWKDCFAKDNLLWCSPALYSYYTPFCQ